MLLSVTSPPSLADDNAPLKRGGFQLKVSPIYKAATIYVTTNADGTEGEITPSQIRLGLSGKMDFRWPNGYVERAGLFAGQCRRTACGNNTLLWFKSGSRYTGSAADSGSFGKNDWHINSIVTTTSDRLVSVFDKTALISRCRQSASGSFDHGFSVTLSANTRTQDTREKFESIDTEIDINDVEFNGGDQSRQAAFSLRVECQRLSHTASPKAPRVPAGQGLGFNKGRMKVKDIKLTFTTFQNGFSQPNPGTRCKTARLRVRLETNQAGLVSFKLWQQRANQAVTSKDYIIGSHHDGNGHFFAQKDFEVSVDKTSTVQAKAREQVSETFQKEDGWKKILLHCRGSGGTGGLASATRDDNTAPKPQLQGGFQLLDNSAAARRNTCNRTAGALIWFSNNKPTNIHYSLDCRYGGHFSGVLQPKPITGGKYRAAKLEKIPITDTVNERCALSTVAPGQPRTHATVSRNFTCHKTSGHAAGGGRLSARAQSTHAAPARNGTGRHAVDRPRTGLECNGGTSLRGQCTCPRGTIRSRTGRNKYRCVKQQAKITCRGGTIVSNTCRCPSSQVRTKVSSNGFRCIKKRSR
ncbi:MAG: hypothetical protein ACK5JT_11510 [Hyphomicrobiaceae bacterium]